jgi:hypothetical protein
MTYPGADPIMDPDRAAVEARRKEQEIEFSTYRAIGDIPWGTVTAFYAGEVVPKSTVEDRGWLDMGLVEKIDTKDAKEASAPATPAASKKSTSDTKTGSDS